MDADHVRRATYTYVRARETLSGAKHDVHLRRVSAGIVGMWEKENVDRSCGQRDVHDPGSWLRNSSVAFARSQTERISLACVRRDGTRSSFRREPWMVGGPSTRGHRSRDAAPTEASASGSDWRRPLQI